MSTYSVQKYKRHWCVLNSADPEWKRNFDRKGEAIAAIPKFENEDKHIARLFAMQESGTYEWTPSELQEINRFAHAIKLGETRLTLSGRKTVEEIGRKEHTDDTRAVASWHALGPVMGPGKQICAEIAWRQAARIEAFRRAGLTLG